MKKFSEYQLKYDPKDLVFKQETHQYFYKDIEVKSPSTILGMYSNQIYNPSPVSAKHQNWLISNGDFNVVGAIRPEIIEVAFKRGTAIHLASEKIDFNLSYDINPEWINYVNAYLEFKKEHPEIIVIDIEIDVYNPEFGIAGKLDKRAYIEKMGYGIIDIKNTEYMKHKLTALQMTLYAMGLIANDVPCDWIASLQLSKTGKYVLTFYDLQKFIPIAKEFIRTYFFSTIPENTLIKGTMKGQAEFKEIVVKDNGFFGL